MSKNKRHNKLHFREHQKCPTCGYKNNKAKLEFCNCGCNVKRNNNLLCKTCGFTTF